MENLEKAKEYFLENKYTLVFAKDEKILTSYDKGVKPLLNLLELNIDLSEFSAVDKVVGMGAAFLHVLLKTKEIYTPTISTPALKILKQNNINVSFDNEVKRITNRKGDGFCPIESALLNCNNANDALDIIKTTLEKLEA